RPSNSVQRPAAAAVASQPARRSEQQAAGRQVARWGLPWRRQTDRQDLLTAWEIRWRRFGRPSGTEKRSPRPPRARWEASQTAPNTPRHRPSHALCYSPPNRRRAMVAAVVTGIADVDRELERRAPFADAETAEVVANRLLAVW